MSNIETNYGFNKCGTFEEVAHLALMRALSINGAGAARVNIYVNNKREISCHFYSDKFSRTVHYSHVGSLNSSLDELDKVFLQFESTEKEVCHA